jgi:NAD(P)-dependent dehydrogenase (short-subunit alcohol dehydrogenase family)
MKNVVITGSTRGIGFHMAIEFLRLDAVSHCPAAAKTLSDSVKSTLATYIGSISMYHAMFRIRQVAKPLGCVIGKMGSGRYMDQ